MSTMFPWRSYFIPIIFLVTPCFIMIILIEYEISNEPKRFIAHIKYGFNRLWKFQSRTYIICWWNRYIGKLTIDNVLKKLVSHLHWLAIYDRSRNAITAPQTSQMFFAIREIPFATIELSEMSKFNRVKNEIFSNKKMMPYRNILSGCKSECFFRIKQPI